LRTNKSRPLFASFLDVMTLLSADEGATLTPEKVLAGHDGWKP
jgi:hypothetical protein